MPSSVIRDYSYDENREELLVDFVTGRRYLYSEVPPDIVAGLSAAFSKGRYFNARIRDAFDYVELEPVGR